MLKQLIKYSHYKTIGFQTLSYVGGPLVLYYNFNATYLFFAWLFSWITLHVGISIGMHRLFTHRTFEPKNNIITVVLHFLSLITTIGGTIAWAATHRTHHKHSDTELDPHCVSGASLFTKIRYWFNYIPDHKVSAIGRKRYRRVRKRTQKCGGGLCKRGVMQIIIRFLKFFLSLFINRCSNLLLNVCLKGV